MESIETDYLVIGAGASAMAFVDTFLDHSDAEIIIADARHQPGGHWNDAYPFVQLHQPAACYGVDSTELGQLRIDETGDNRGMFELSSAQEICAYFADVMERRFLTSGRVRYLSMTEVAVGERGEIHLRSLLTGKISEVRVRRKLVDASYMQPDIPARRPPEYAVHPGVNVLTPNQLVNLAASPAGFTVIGAGKTAMDVCTWLLTNGVEPDLISWVRPRDGWFLDRSWNQPLTMVETRLRYQAAWAKAAASASTGKEMAHLLEDEGLLLRLDKSVDATGFRGATLSRPEHQRLTQIERVVRAGRVRSIGSNGIELEMGKETRPRGEVYVDCTATGLRSIVTRPIFEADRISMQYTTPGFACWSAATLGMIEALYDGDTATQNHLALPVVYTGHVDDLLSFTAASLHGAKRRGAEPTIGPWYKTTRLNPARGYLDRASESSVGNRIAEWQKWTDMALERLPEPTLAAVS